MSSFLGTLAVKLRADTAEFVKDLDGAKSRLQGVSDTAKKVATVAGVAFGGMALLGAKFVKVASDMDENMNVVRTSFGKMTPEVIKWARTAASEMGRSEFQMREFAGTAQAMLSPMMGSKEAAAGMSMQIAQLAVDIGSFNNVADADALIAIKAGLIGSIEPMMKFGVVMNVAALDAFALSKGINKSMKEMSAAEKVSLRYAFIMEKTSLQQGDAAKTADGFANVMKGIQGLFVDIAGDIGATMLPMVTSLAAKIKDLLVWFKNLSPEAKKLAGTMLTLGTALAGGVAALATIAAVLPNIVGGFGLMTSAVTKTFIAVVSLKGALIGVAVVLASIGVAIYGMVKNLRDVQVATESIAPGSGVSIEEGKAAMGRLSKSGGGSTDFMGQGGVEGAGARLVAGLKRGFGDLADVADDVTKDLINFGDANTNTGKLIKDAANETDKALRGLLGDSKGGRGGKGGSDVISQQLMGVVGEMNADDAAFDALITQQLMNVVEEMNADDAAIDAAITQQLTDLVKEMNIDDAAMGLGEAISYGAGILGDAFLAGTETLGDVVEGAKAGMEAGGPWGAVIGAIAALAQKTEAFSAMIDYVNQAMDVAVGMLNQILLPVSKLIQAIVTNLMTLNALTNVTSGFGTAIEVFGYLMEAVSWIVGKITWSITSVWNWIVDTLASFVSKIPKIGDDLADSIRTARIDIQRATRPSTGTSFADSILDLNGDMGNLGDTVSALNQSLTNVPEGFKVQAARYRAIDESQEAGAAGAPVSAGAGVSGTFNINVGTPEDAAQIILDTLEDQGYEKSGSRLGGPAWGTDTGGA